MIKNLLLGAALLASAAQAPATAADLSGAAPVQAPAYKTPAAPPAYDWTGWYLGGNAGYGRGRGQDDATPLPYGPPPNFNVAALSLNADPKGWLGGIQVGYNWQAYSWVFGIESDIDYAGMKGDGSYGPLLSLSNAPPYILSYQTGHQEINWFGTVRARVGFTPLDRVLIYATGGYAFGRVQTSDVMRLTPGGFPNYWLGSQSQWRSGWTVGGGIEWAYNGHWTIKAEYLYFDLGKSTDIANLAPIPTPPYVVQNIWQTKGSIARIGLNYKL